MNLFDPLKEDNEATGRPEDFLYIFRKTPAFTPKEPTTIDPEDHFGVVS
jgi:hypothetical protein